MLTPCNHASPPSISTQPSLRLARPARNAFTSVPVRTIPASNVSSTLYSWYAFLLRAITFFALAAALARSATVGFAGFWTATRTPLIDGLQGYAITRARRRRRRAGAASEPGQGHRVDGGPVDPDLEVDMAAGHVAGGAGVPDRLPARDRLSLRHRERGQVVVDRDVGLAVDHPVVDDHLVAVGAVVVRELHGRDRPVGDGVLAVAARGTQVDAVVHVPAPGDRVHPVAVGRGDVQRAGDGGAERVGGGRRRCGRRCRGRRRGRGRFAAAGVTPRGVGVLLGEAPRLLVGETLPLGGETLFLGDACL